MVRKEAHKYRGNKMDMERTVISTLLFLWRIMRIICGSYFLRVSRQYTDTLFINIIQTVITYNDIHGC